MMACGMASGSRRQQATSTSSTLQTQAVLISIIYHMLTYYNGECLVRRGHRSRSREPTKPEIPTLNGTLLSTTVSTAEIASEVNNNDGRSSRQSINLSDDDSVTLVNSKGEAVVDDDVFEFPTGTRGRTDEIGRMSTASSQSRASTPPARSNVTRFGDGIIDDDDEAKLKSKTKSNDDKNTATSTTTTTSKLKVGNSYHRRLRHSSVPPSSAAHRRRMMLMAIPKPAPVLASEAASSSSKSKSKRTTNDSSSTNDAKRTNKPTSNRGAVQRRRRRREREKKMKDHDRDVEISPEPMLTKPRVKASTEKPKERKKSSKSHLLIIAK
jgi:hypothetical protein